MCFLWMFFVCLFVLVLFLSWLDYVENLTSGITCLQHLYSFDNSSVNQQNQGKNGFGTISEGVLGPSASHYL